MADKNTAFKPAAETPPSAEEHYAEQNPSFIEENTEELTGLPEQYAWAALSYVGILVAAPLIMRRDDPFVRLHVRQGVVLLGALIAAIALAYWLPAVGGLLFLLLLVVDVIAIFMTLQGRQWKIPLIGTIAQHLRIL